MGLDKLTTKFQEALQAAQQLASKSANAELKSIHVLLALLQQDGGIVVPILEKAGVNVTSLKAAALGALEKEPRIQGAASQPQMSYGLRANLDAADEIRTELGDDYLSVEHFLLGALKSDSPAGKLLKDAGFDRKKADAALKEVRGSQKVTDEDPEGKYQTLEKYGMDRETVIKDVMLERQPSKEFATTEQLGGVATFLCSDAATQITGTTISVDGGWTAL